jgi:hypothetical protein
VDFSAFPTKATPQIPKNKKRGTQTGASLSQLFPGASGFLHFFSSCFQSLLVNPSFFSNHRKHALTKKIVLSNIRFVAGGSSEC